MGRTLVILMAIMHRHDIDKYRYFRLMNNSPQIFIESKYSRQVHGKAKPNLKEMKQKEK